MITPTCVGGIDAQLCPKGMYGSQTRDFGNYLLHERIGAGGMAEIFLATAPGIEGFDKQLVIKKILPSLSGDDQFVKMFIEEARLCVFLRHPNVVQVFDLGEIEDQYFIAMEYVAGRDLLKTLAGCAKQRVAFPTDLALYIIMEVLKGLDYAHNLKRPDGQALGIIHRDVSPSNVLLSFDGAVKISDFGIAKASIREKTATGILKGKFGYMAPEQVTGSPIDHRADVFAVGILLYELLTGHRLFAGRSDLAVLERVRDAQIDPPPRHYRPDLDRELENIVLKSLARDADDRFQSTAELHDALYDYTFRSGVVIGPRILARFMQNLFGDADPPSASIPMVSSVQVIQDSQSPRGRANGRGRSNGQAARQRPESATSQVNFVYEDVIRPPPVKELIRPADDGIISIGPSQVEEIVEDDAEESTREANPRIPSSPWNDRPIMARSNSVELRRIRQASEQDQETALDLDDQKPALANEGTPMGGVPVVDVLKQRFDDDDEMLETIQGDDATDAALDPLNVSGQTSLSGVVFRPTSKSPTDLEQARRAIAHRIDRTVYPDNGPAAADDADDDEGEESTELFESEAFVEAYSDDDLEEANASDLIELTAADESDPSDATAGVEIPRPRQLASQTAHDADVPAGAAEPTRADAIPVGLDRDPDMDDEPEDEVIERADEDPTEGMLLTPEEEALLKNTGELPPLGRAEPTINEATVRAEDPIAGIEPTVSQSDATVPTSAPDPVTGAVGDFSRALRMPSVETVLGDKPSTQDELRGFSTIQEDESYIENADDEDRTEGVHVEEVNALRANSAEQTLRPAAMDSMLSTAHAMESPLPRNGVMNESQTTAHEFLEDHQSFLASQQSTAAELEPHPTAATDAQLARPRPVLVAADEPTHPPARRVRSRRPVKASETASKRLATKGALSVVNPRVGKPPLDEPTSRGDLVDMPGGAMPRDPTALGALDGSDAAVPAVFDPSSAARPESSGVTAALSEAAQAVLEIEEIRKSSGINIMDMPDEHTAQGDLRGLLGDQPAPESERPDLDDDDDLETQNKPAPSYYQVMERREAKRRFESSSVILFDDSEEQTRERNPLPLDHESDVRAHPITSHGRLKDRGASDLFGALSVLDRPASELNAEPGFEDDEVSMEPTAGETDAQVGSVEIVAPSVAKARRKQESLRGNQIGPTELGLLANDPALSSPALKFETNDDPTDTSLEDELDGELDSELEDVIDRNESAIALPPRGRDALLIPPSSRPDFSAIAGGDYLEDALGDLIDDGRSDSGISLRLEYAHDEEGAEDDSAAMALPEPDSSFEDEHTPLAHEDDMLASANPPSSSDSIDSYDEGGLEPRFDSAIGEDFSTGSAGLLSDSFAMIDRSQPVESAPNVVRQASVHNRKRSIRAPKAPAPALVAERAPSPPQRTPQPSKSSPPSADGSREQHFRKVVERVRPARERNRAAAPPPKKNVQAVTATGYQPAPASSPPQVRPQPVVRSAPPQARPAPAQGARPAGPAGPQGARRPEPPPVELVPQRSLATNRVAIGVTLAAVFMMLLVIAVLVLKPQPDAAKQIAPTKSVASADALEGAGTPTPVDPTIIPAPDPKTKVADERPTEPPLLRSADPVDGNKAAPKLDKPEAAPKPEPEAAPEPEAKREPAPGPKRATKPARRAPPKRSTTTRPKPKPKAAASGSKGSIKFKCNAPVDVLITGVATLKGVSKKTLEVEAPKTYRVTVRRKDGTQTQQFVRVLSGKTSLVPCN